MGDLCTQKPSNAHRPKRSLGIRENIFDSSKLPYASDFETFFLAGFSRSGRNLVLEFQSSRASSSRELVKTLDYN